MPSPPGMSLPPRPMMPSFGSPSSSPDFSPQQFSNFLAASAAFASNPWYLAALADASRSSNSELSSLSSPPMPGQGSTSGFPMWSVEHEHLIHSSVIHLILIFLNVKNILIVYLSLFSFVCTIQVKV
jgi:hypothetical protein